jgi:N-acetylglucosaminyldiphosphoundecaprenol N-acetyl-beta-D-mannosaminyltransferase
MGKNDRVSILGVEVDNLSLEDALSRLDGFIVGGEPHHVVTLNPEFLVMARNAPKFLSVLQNAQLALADGVGLLWASRILGRPLQARLTGVDMVRHLTKLAAEKGYETFFLGAGKGIAEKTASVLVKEHPGLVVAGCYEGSPLPKDEDQIITKIKEANPKVLLVAFGAPEQELWINRNLSRLGVPVAMGVGGAFDYISGSVSRAPGWMRRLGLEWLFRLIRQPWRWRRMLRLPKFALLVVAQRLNLGREV